MASPEYKDYLELVKILHAVEAKREQATGLERVTLNDSVKEAVDKINTFVASKNLQPEIDQQIKFNYINPIAKAVMADAEHLQKKIGKDLPEVFASAGPSSYQDNEFIKQLSEVNTSGKHERNLNQILSLYAVLAAMKTDFQEPSWGKQPTEILKSISESANAKNNVTVSPQQQMEAFKLNFDNVRLTLGEKSSSIKSSVGSLFGSVSEKEKMINTVDKTFAKYQKEIYVPDARSRPESPHP